MFRDVDGFNDAGGVDDDAGGHDDCVGDNNNDAQTSS